MSFTTLTETVGEGELSFTLTWELATDHTAEVVISHLEMLYAQAAIPTDGCLEVAPADGASFTFGNSNDVKLHLALLKWIYIRGRELTKNPNMEAW